MSKASKGPDADPCSTWYPGHRAFEAPEVNNIANYVQTLPNLKAFIDLRSYGQMCMYSSRRLISGIVDNMTSIVSIPFSWSCKKTPKDAEDLLEAALRATNAIKQAHGTVFTVRNLCIILRFLLTHECHRLAASASNSTKLPAMSLTTCTRKLISNTHTRYTSAIPAQYVFFLLPFSCHGIYVCYFVVRLQPACRVDPTCR